MKKFYEAPELFVDEYVADTMIASSGTFVQISPKNGRAGNNQNCWGCDLTVNVVGQYGDACLAGGFDSNHLTDEECGGFSDVW